MVILRQQMRSKPERTDDVLAALAAIVPGARATQGVISLDIARDLLDPDSFVATGVYEDGAALERQESAPEVHRAMAMFSGGARGAPRPKDLRSVAPPDSRLEFTKSAGGRSPADTCVSASGALAVGDVEDLACDDAPLPGHGRTLS